MWGRYVLRVLHSGLFLFFMLFYHQCLKSAKNSATTQLWSTLVLHEKRKISRTRTILFKNCTGHLQLQTRSLIPLCVINFLNHGCLKPFQRFSLRAWSHPNVGQVHVQRAIKHGSKPGGETSFVSLGEQFSFKMIGRHVPVPVIQPWFHKSWDAVNNIKCFHLLYPIMCSTKCWTSPHDTCGNIQTGVFGALHNIPSLLLAKSQLVGNVSPPFIFTIF